MPSRTAELVGLWESFDGRPVSRGSAGRTHRFGTNGRAAAGRNGRANGLIPPRQAGQTDLSPAALKRLARWLEGTSDRTPVTPAELLVLNEILLEAGGDLPAHLHWRLWRTALTAADGVIGQSDSPAGHSAAADQRLVTAGELAWQAGLLFAGVKGASQWLNTGRRTIKTELLERTDTDGTPAAAILPRLTLWLASLVRAASWAERFRADLWDDESARRFHLLVRVAGGLCRGDGRLAMSGVAGPAVFLLASAARLSGWRENSHLAKYLSDVENGQAETRSSLAGRAGRPAKSKGRSQRPVTQSDWARFACLRTGWTTDADVLAVAHHRDTPVLELSALGVPLVSGAWEIEVAIDGRPVRLPPEWSCICWFSDADGDYLELQACPARGVTIDRQVLLSRTARFALFADCISARRGARIDYVSRLPVVERAAAKPDRATRECGLKAPGVSARVFPLALPAERVMSTPGSFAALDGRLELRQTATGGLYAPVVIDWHPARRRSYTDWRRLTVSEDGRRLASDIACGHRLRIGGHQLLIYRSLKRSEQPRAVLGHHTLHETVIGRFTPGGGVEPILLVE